jgi:hypothetical protein
VLGRKGGREQGECGNVWEGIAWELRLPSNVFPAIINGDASDLIPVEPIL